MLGLIAFSFVLLLLFVLVLRAVCVDSLVVRFGVWECLWCVALDVDLVCYLLAFGWLVVSCGLVLVVLDCGRCLLIDCVLSMDWCFVD